MSDEERKKLPGFLIPDFDKDTVMAKFYVTGDAAKDQAVIGRRELARRDPLMRTLSLIDRFPVAWPRLTCWLIGHKWRVRLCMPPIFLLRECRRCFLQTDLLGESLPPPFDH